MNSTRSMPYQVEARPRLMFFVGRPYIYRGHDGDYFKAVFPVFREIAVTCLDEIRGRIRRPVKGINTSVTKVIDNAILGFMPMRSRRGPRVSITRHLPETVQPDVDGRARGTLDGIHDGVPDQPLQLR